MRQSGSPWVVLKVKIVGRLESMMIMKARVAVLFSLLVSVSSYASLILKACNEYGQPATTFNVGVPWILDVVLQDMPDVKEPPAIKGLEGAYARGGSMMTTIINGKTTVKYSYKVRIDAAGNYTIGPATVDGNGQIYSSNTVTVKVIDQPADAPDAKDKNKSSVLFVRMKVDKDRVVVGEKFKCILRCYYTDQVNQVAPSSTMQLAGFVFEDGVQQANGVETLRGVNYNYFELCWQAHATQAGKKTIPAYSVDYLVNTNPYGSHASAIAMMLGHSFGEQKRAYSNVVPITVDALPAHAGPVHAIGTFTHFSAKLDPVVAKQGEGMVLTLEVIGQGTFDKEQGIDLQHMPSQFKYYDSKQYEDKANSSKKYFEFIVQGLSDGEWEVPRQQFTFYDTKSRSYKTLETNAIRVKIIPNLVAQQMAAPPESMGQSLSDSIDAIDEIKPLITLEDTMSRTLPSLPLWLMAMFVLLPLAFFCYEGIKNRTNLFDRINRRSRKNNAFMCARNEVKDMVAQQRLSSLYKVFVKLFATRCSVDEHEVNQEFMYDLLQKSGMQQQELDQWQQFYHQLNELMFFNKPIKSNEHQIMQQYAYRWIDRLEKIL